MAVWTLIKKELRLMARDRVAAILLLLTPLLFIFVLGLLVGEGFGQPTDDRLRVSVVDLDTGSGLNPGEPWSKVVQRDLAETAGIKVEVIDSREEAERLIAEHRRAAVLVFNPGFTASLNKCSFLVDGINPFHREGVYLGPDKVDAEMLRDDKQPLTRATIEQVVQVSLLRVILPLMIGKAFERLSEPSFIKILGEEVRLPVPSKFSLFMPAEYRDRVKLAYLLEMASGKDPKKAEEYRGKVGEGVQNALKEQFKKYNLRGKTWASLTKSEESKGGGAETTKFVDQSGSGPIGRGAFRYQVLVPAYTVMFAFFLVLIVGWVFVAERRQGTLKRLQAAPLRHSQVLMGKLIPSFVGSVGQSLFLLLAGWALFGMRLGPEGWPWLTQLGWLLLVVCSTSLAAMGLALLVAVQARSELQVILFGALPVLAMSLLGGCVLPREMMPEGAQKLGYLTPHGWALDAYRELLGTAAGMEPNTHLVLQACAVLVAIGGALLALAWGLLRLD
jgi:ABC-type Na+ efflux pump permease subunit